jgi:hypothetical protein
MWASVIALENLLNTLEKRDRLCHEVAHRMTVVVRSFEERTVFSISIWTLMVSL